MAKKHDESKDIRSLSKVCKIRGNEISCSKSTVLGIKRLGMIDYLTKYCGYHFFWDNSARGTGSSNDTKANVKKARQARKEAKQPKLKNKRK